MALSIHLFLQKKRVPHLSGAGGTNRRGEEGEGGLRALSPCCSRTTHPFLPLRPARSVRSDEIRSLEGSEVIGRENCWREISIHYTPLTSKGKTEVRSCAPAEAGRNSGKLTLLLVLEKGASQNLLLTSCWIEVEHSPSARQQQRGFDSRYTRCGEKD